MPVRVALEIMRYHSDICDPCITYPGLLDIARDVDSTKVGFCWDIGHALSSVAQDRLELDPPSEFLRRVIHVHVHDVAPDGDTHWPLTDNPLLVHIIRKLVTAGYRGVYNLELSPPRWPPGTDVRAKALESIQRLQDDIIEEADD
jgi:sugar phosphate isomerase/epimerase